MIEEMQYSPQGSTKVLRNAVRFGLVPIPGALDPISKKLAASLLLNEIPTKDPDLQVPYENAKSQVYWEHHFPIETQPEVHNGNGGGLRGGIGGGIVSTLPEWVMELARFPVPHGCFGVLKSIEQYLYNNDQEITRSSNWGVPYQEDQTGPLEWLLRLDNFDGWLPPRFGAINSAYVPGSPYSELGTIDHIWFPSGSPTVWTNSMIPGGHVLRFFLHASGECVGRLSVMGRLRGFYQSVYSSESAFVARTNW